MCIDYPGNCATVTLVVTTSPTPAADQPVSSAASSRVLWLATVSFTLLFAVWLMFGVLGVPIRDEFGLDDGQLAWLTSVAILNGALWRLPAGMAADRFGGKWVMIALLASSAVPSFLLAFASDHATTSYGRMLLYAFLVGFAGNAFTSGIAWVSAWWPRERQGLALGVFGAGNVGASVTKLVGPGLIAAVPAVGYLGGWIPGGWRIVPFFYGVAVLVAAVATLALAPRHDRKPGHGRPLREQLAPLRHVRVCRFSLYYVVVFGAYVALSAWLPKYYVDVYGLKLRDAALLTALFIFPASLLRPWGGWLSDRMGARRLMYATFAAMLVASGILMMPYGHIVVVHGDGSTSEVLPWEPGVGWFTALVIVIGIAMGVGKAAVYKHIPEYFPGNVGAVGGLVGSLGALGGFIMPPAFAWASHASNMPQATFAVIFAVTLIAAAWMHLTVWRMLHVASPGLAHQFDDNGAGSGPRVSASPAQKGAAS